MMVRLRTILKLFTDSYKVLLKNDPLRMAGATAFFTTFALPAILMIILQILGIVLNPQESNRELFDKLSRIIGKQSANQLIHILRGFQQAAHNWIITTIGFLFLLFVATTLFKIINNSLNKIWKIRVIKKQSFFLNLRGRLKGLVIIISAGVLLLVGMLIEGAQTILHHQIEPDFRYASMVLNISLTYLLSVIIVTAWFTLIFCFLPDGRPGFRIGLTGAFVTSLLFNLGKWFLKWILINSNINSIFGASASLVLLLLFVFYSSLIFYFGAAFTAVWGAEHNKPIQPLPYATHYRLKEDHEGGD